MQYERGSLRKHEELKQRILKHPELIGINKKQILRIQTEYPLQRKKHTVARPDIVIEYEENGILKRTFIEVKSGSCRRAREDLDQQLRKYLQYKKMFGDVRGIFWQAGSISIVV